ncbi:hypothetical protein Aph01nite_49740 [Acrocarpospora phusangensis]|uniref:Dihydrolipoamide acetyltransferase component of pyruvate dehydrogenase complex n=1 Tax=Acrocarpospora phusangensis TaxID=1070424 RepID=A0A919QF56_9ACTN|nr:2-oxo acid dehydrogenase subunit E2 [Acrocarpospora phusangensis]GIH26664.1 hypothetical protein Aph01nite_49740 [Acrocarpospora phusangensis]
MIELRVPKLNNNDATYILVEWIVENGTPVKSGDPIAVIETSKAAEEIAAESDGYLWQSIPLNADCAPGQRLAHLTTSPEPPELSIPLDAERASNEPLAHVPTSYEPPGATNSLSKADAHGRPPGTTSSGTPAALNTTTPAEPRPPDSAQTAASGSSTRYAATGDAAAAVTGPNARGGVASPVAAGGRSPLITAPAQALLDELGIPAERVNSLGLSVIRRADVERLVERASAATYELPRVQRAVARAVQVSHATIPAAYTVMAMDMDGTLEVAARMTREVRRPVGLAELFVLAVARLHDEFPMFFATLTDDRTARLARSPNVGVTVDTGEGLYVPVIHDAASRSLKDVATRLMEYRLASTTGDFRESDLADANIAVTLHHDADVSLAIPFIFPGHACALAITTPQPVLTLNDGTLTTKKVANIGLAYDHRLINGREAALFLRALKNTIAELERLPD